eukprot:TRINITY_DN8509_c0_g1_i6.p1 TRINITY_DN8509_c0_g1~~TRINITY_DN8509_c0_g1_i6.p1  ORF type:complete len:202 (-),score=65.91 TRINITY_DN8509_c0_g1_i6:98-703(-)
MQALSKLNSDINEMRTKYRQIEEDLAASISTLREDLVSKNDEYNHLRQMCENLSKTHENLLALKQSVEEAVVAQEENVNKLEAAVDEKNLQLQQCLQRLKETEQRQDELQRVLNEQQERQSSLTKEIEGLFGVAEELKTIENTLKTRVKKLKAKEDTILVMMALSGEQLEKSQYARIQKLIEQINNSDQDIRKFLDGFGRN